MSRAKTGGQRILDRRIPADKIGEPGVMTGRRIPQGRAGKPATLHRQAMQSKAGELPVPHRLAPQDRIKGQRDSDKRIPPGRNRNVRHSRLLP